MLQNQTVAAVIVAAGASRRMGFDKLFYEIDGVTVLEKSIMAFDRHPAIDELIVVAGENVARVTPLLKRVQKPVQLVRGGPTRACSVRNGVACTDAAYIAIHDAARPFVSEQIISQALAACCKTGAAAPAVPVKDTIKVAQEDGLVLSTPDRRTLFAVQTPQCFCTAQYRRAIDLVKNDDITDDCSLFELAGFPVTLTQGGYENYKITTRDDLRAGQGESVKLRIGHGYDVHRLAPGRAFILGGVEIPFEKGLLGHSDADVLTHAVMDALLGAAALGDIGHFFPDTDPAYAGADSIALLRQVCAALRTHGYAPVNIDATVLCQAPKLAPHIMSMRVKLAAAAGLSVEDVSVKATTEEYLGFTGAGDGVAAHSVCLVKDV